MPGTIFSSLYNAIDYRMRQLIAWRRADLSIKNEPKDGLYSKLDASQRMRAVRTAERLVNTYHQTTLDFPFVFLADRMRWGLPRRPFNPEQSIGYVLNSLREGAPLIIVDQGEAEAAAKGKLLAQLSISICAGFPYDSRFFPSDLLRYVTSALRNVHYPLDDRPLRMRNKLQ